MGKKKAKKKGRSVGDGAVPGVPHAAVDDTFSAHPRTDDGALSAGGGGDGAVVVTSVVDTPRAQLSADDGALPAGGGGDVTMTGTSTGGTYRAESNAGGGDGALSVAGGGAITRSAPSSRVEQSGQDDDDDDDVAGDVGGGSDAEIVTVVQRGVTNTQVERLASEQQRSRNGSPSAVWQVHSISLLFLFLFVACVAFCLGQHTCLYINEAACTHARTHTHTHTHTLAHT
jgi:hypothetical protein